MTDDDQRVYANDVDRDSVWVVRGGGERESYHVDPECEYLQRSHRGSKQVSVTHRVLAGLDLCRACGVETTRPASRPTLASKLTSMDADDVGGGV